MRYSPQRKIMADKKNRIIIKHLKDDSGIQIDYSKSLDLQLVEVLTTKKAFLIVGEETEDNYKKCNRVETIVGYVIKNNGKEPHRYLKATYGDNEISYSEAFINSGESVVITRHELYGLKLFNGARLSLPDGIGTKNNIKLPNENVCIIVTSTHIPTYLLLYNLRRNFTPYIQGISYSIRLVDSLQKSIDDYDELSNATKIKPEYQEKFNWLMNRNFFKNRYTKRKRKKSDIIDIE